MNSLKNEKEGKRKEGKETDYVSERESERARERQRE